MPGVLARSCLTNASKVFQREKSNARDLRNREVGNETKNMLKDLLLGILYGKWVPWYQLSVESTIEELVVSTFLGSFLLTDSNAPSNR